jgi:hypothetical protein
MKYSGLIFIAMLLVQFMASVQGQQQTYTCRTIDWDNDLAGLHLNDGTVISNQYAPLFTVSGAGREEAGVPRIFDSSNPNPLDLDLGTPNNACPGGGPGKAQLGPQNNAAPGRPGENCVARGNVLILSKPAPEAPNDLQNGGTLTFNFAQPVRVDEAGILDIETRERAGTIKLYGAGGALLFTGNLSPFGDNTYQTVGLGATEGVLQIVVDFKGSGAVTHLKICVPEEGFPGCPPDSVCPCDADTRTSSVACLDRDADPQVRHHTHETQLVLQFLDTDNINAGNGCESDSASE